MVLGTWGEVLAEARPPKATYSVDEIPDLTGRVMIVTGGNTGIGYHTVKALLEHNAKVYMLSRSREKAEAAIAQLKEETGKQAYLQVGDLANIASIKKAAREFKEKESELHVLFNSGGVMIPPIDYITSDGYDLQFGTNVLGHAILTTELLPLLLAGAKSSPDKKARIVNTSSSVAYRGSIQWDTVRDEGEGAAKRRKLGTSWLYDQSKFGVVVFSNELARRYGDQGLVSVALNPGNLKTELQRHMTNLQQKVVNLLLYPAAMGALTQLWAGTSTEGASFNGKWLVPWARLKEKQPNGAEDKELGKKLWGWIEEQSAHVNA